MALVDLGPFAKENGLTVPDPENFTNRVTDMEGVKKLVKGFKDCVFVSNWAELIANEMCIVVRCHPLELIKRLTDREYSMAKIQENVEAECLDYCLISALDNNPKEKVGEIDNSKNLDLNANMVASIIQGNLPVEHGKVDYSEYVDKVGELIKDSI